MTGTVTRIPSSPISGLILAANPARRGAVIRNTDAYDLLLLLASGIASASNLSVRVATGASYEVPYGYRGVINGVWTGFGPGAAVVTEFAEAKLGEASA